MSSLDQIYLDGAKCATNGIFKNLFFLCLWESTKYFHDLSINFEN